MNSCTVDRLAIQQTIVRAIEAANASRDPHSQLETSADAALFGAPSPLDSLSLVALLIDIEDAFAAQGCIVALSDARALSERRSPFRTVPALAAYIERQLLEAAA